MDIGFKVVPGRYATAAEAQAEADRLNTQEGGREWKSHD
jgi:hypothetical protein